MINSIRSVRRAKRMTLDEVAARCKPPTTAQTIGRLETGTRTLSLGWLNRIAGALGVDASELVRMPNEDAIAIAAIIDGEGAQAPTREELLPPLRTEAGMLAVRFAVSIGDYRAGDQLWCKRLTAQQIAAHINRDLLIPRPAGRYAFGRLLAVDDVRINLLPLADGARQQVFAMPQWAAVATQLIRPLK